MAWSESRLGCWVLWALSRPMPESTLASTLWLRV